MTLSAQGFPGSVTDEGFSELLSLLGNDGTSGFNVSGGGSGTTLRVRVSEGISHLSGVLIKSTETETVTLPANGSSFDRIDRIILRATWGGSGSFQLTYLEGSPSSNPQARPLTRNPGEVYEVSLAEVRLSSGHGEITSSDITRTNTPPATGFYYITSIAQAPDPALGALIYYAPTGEIRIGTPSGYKAIAGGSASALQLPSPGGSGWDHKTTYQARATEVEVNVFIYRTGGGTGFNNVVLGVLPAGARPPAVLYRTVMNQHSGASFLVEIETTGVITCIGMQADAGERIRGGFHFFI